MEKQKPGLFVRVLLIASLLLLLLAVGSEHVSRPPPTAGPTPGLGPSDMAVVGGQRADFVTLGLPVTRVEERLGQGVIRPSEESVIHLYPDYGLSVGAVHGRVVSIYIQSPNFTTRSNIRVGSDVDAVVRTFGSGYEFEGTEQDYTLHYWPQGIHFSVQNNQVAGIQVTEALESAKP